ncbi:serine--tRNA ligase [Patescibacteria group bacterium]|nr:serine--tRNA ligase [Patescibacteria group bacterium]MCG2701923.1 serine--tRNA ligase [Candidatus Parcubacteria bacterium]MBU4265182.1 serine--tRNA ligase [Patescibacteria group bacterium]MBU4390746.1 serine--tRNA ligase [Patescibacteria group bacterium]MBU4396973.1 serine--tRNA ligase [Patescibacteria group bacterium]
MLDKNFVNDNLDLIKKALKDRQIKLDLLGDFSVFFQQRKKLINQIDQLKYQQNQISKNIKNKPSEEQIQNGLSLKKQLKKLTPLFKESEEKLQKILEKIPNIPASDVPIGKDDSENIVIKTWGKKPDFDFKPLDHVQLGEKLDIIDIKRASKVSGSRFGYFKNQAAVLEMSLMFYVFKKLTQKGFISMIPPAMIKASSEWKMGYTDTNNLNNAYYHLSSDDLVFISSSEHSVVPYHMDEILEAKKLPLKYVNFSPCFRREAGTYGKDTQGLFRVHFFNKVEMNIFTLPDTKISDAVCKEMLSIQEEIMQDLEIPYQVMNCCTGDLPQPNRKMYDINAWFPSQNKYKETHSCSNCTDYQARRLNIKTKINGQSQFVHILNATAITDRALIAILENNQQKDTSIKIPQVLIPFTNFQFISPNKNN